MRGRFFAALAGAVVPRVPFGSAGARDVTPALRDGDIVFHAPRSAQSAAVQAATRSRYSHTGVVMTRNGRRFVFEAEKRVRYTSLESWLARGEGGHDVARRLRTPLSEPQMERLRRTAGSFQGQPCVAVLEWSDQRIHCPGLTCKLLDRALGLRIGETAALGGFALDDTRVLSMLRRRHGEAAPPGETVITPQATFDSPLLEAVAER